jgi:hypothetical protein
MGEAKIAAATARHLADPDALARMRARLDANRMTGAKMSEAIASARDVISLPRMPSSTTGSSRSTGRIERASDRAGRSLSPSPTLPRGGSILGPPRFLPASDHKIWRAHSGGDRRPR